MKKIEGPKLSSVHPSTHPPIRTTRALRALVGLDPEGRKKGSDATENHSYRTT